MNLLCVPRDPCADLLLTLVLGTAFLAENSSAGTSGVIGAQHVTLALPLKQGFVLNSRPSSREKAFLLSLLPTFFFFWYCLEEDPKNAVMTQSHTSFLKNCIFIFNICIGTRDESLRPGLADRKNKYPLSVTSLLRPLKLCYCLNSFSRFSFCSEWNNFQGSSQILFRNRCLEIPSQHFNKND